MSPRPSSLVLAGVAVLSASAVLAGCPREAFIPGCDEAVSTPAASESIASIGWSGQELIDRATGIFVHPDGEWSTGQGATVRLALTPDPSTLELHTLTEQTPPDGAAVASIAPLCFDFLSVTAEVAMEVDGGLDQRFDATVVVTEGDDNPAMRSATISHELDPSTFADPWTWRELVPEEWDTTGLQLSVQLTPAAAAPGALYETGDRTVGDVAEGAAAEVLTWGEAAGDDDDSVGDDDDAVADDDDAVADDDDAAADDDDAAADDDDAAADDDDAAADDDDAAGDDDDSARGR